MLEVVDIDIYEDCDFCGEVKTYKLSKEELEEYLSKYNRK